MAPVPSHSEHTEQQKSVSRRFELPGHKAVTPRPQAISEKPSELLFKYQALRPAEAVRPHVTKTGNTLHASESGLNPISYSGKFCRMARVLAGLTSDRRRRRHADRRFQGTLAPCHIADAFHGVGEFSTRRHPAETLCTIPSRCRPRRFCSWHIKKRRCPVILVETPRRLIADRRSPGWWLSWRRRRSLRSSRSRLVPP